MRFENEGGAVMILFIEKESKMRDDCKMRDERTERGTCYIAPVKRKMKDLEMSIITIY